MFDFNEAVEIALRTWYPKDHELHSNPHHPLGKLLGEWGELLDDYMKSLYKLGYIFEPLDELGDNWYYLRILCSQRRLGQPYVPTKFNMPSNDIDFLISTAMFNTSEAFNSLCRGNSWSIFTLDISYTVLVKICELNDITLQQLTDGNWEKLKPGSVRGEQWMKTRENTGYVGGKVAKR